MTLLFIRELEGFRGDACLVKVQGGEEHFVVSSATVPFGLSPGFETLVFSADSSGKVTSWGEVAGGRGMSREDAFTDLVRELEKEEE